MLKGKFAQVADLLFELGAIKFGAFRLKLHETNPDAPLSPIYLNLRTSDNPKPGPLTPVVLDLIGDVMYGLIHIDRIARFNYFTGIPNAGDPFADALAPKLAGWDKNVEQIHLIKEEKDGKREIVGVQEDLKAIVGYAECPLNVLVVDDLITRADTKLEAIKALEKAELTVTDLLVLVDREQGGREQVVEAGYQLHAIYTLTELLEYYVETDKIELDKAHEVKAYVAANR